MTAERSQTTGRSTSSDAVTDGNRELHEAIITGMLPAISLVTTSDDVIARL